MRHAMKVLCIKGKKLRMIGMYMNYLKTGKNADAVGPSVDKYSKYVMPNMLTLISDNKKTENCSGRSRAVLGRVG